MTTEEVIVIRVRGKGSLDYEGGSGNNRSKRYSEAKIGMIL